MGKQVKIWSGFERAVALCSCLGLSVVLEGCASDGARDEASTAQAEIEKPVSIEIVPQYDTDPTKAIDASHLPKKTIQTPWGPRDIPDQSKNPELWAALETMQRTIADETQLGLYQEMLSKSLIISSIQRNDILRVGCAKLRDSTCAFNFYLYSKDCKSAHNIGSTALTQCEQASFKKILRPMFAYTSCELQGRYVEPLEIFSKETIDEQVDLLLTHECKIWRGQKDWDRDYLASQPVNKPKPKE